MALIILSILFAFCATSNAEDAYVYSSHGRRDPFVPLVGDVSRKAVDSIEDVISIEDVRFQGVAGSGAGGMIAILNGEMLREGETVGHVTIKEVARGKVILMIDENEYTLRMLNDEDF